jgi:hypothetical protein
MKNVRFTLKTLTLMAFMFAVASVANAQATRTWVSGVGDDVNPCSRTAPCKTWAGAISKTAANGEIDALDPGGFGAVTSTKSITLDGTDGGGFGSILASLVNGVNVNDGATGAPGTINVTLRNLSINGAGNGVNGINFTSGKSLNVEGCQIFGFTTSGINVSLTLSTMRVYVKDTSIFNISNGNGVRMTTTSPGGFVTGVFKNVNIEKVAGAGNGNGISLLAGGFATLIDSNISDCVTGVNLNGASNTVNVLNSQVNHNGTGLSVAAGTTARISGSTFIQNSPNNFVNNGTINSHGNNTTDSATIPGVVNNVGLK